MAFVAVRPPMGARPRGPSGREAIRSAVFAEAKAHALSKARVTTLQRACPAPTSARSRVRSRARASAPPSLFRKSASLEWHRCFRPPGAQGQDGRKRRPS